MDEASRLNVALSADQIREAVEAIETWEASRLSACELIAVLYPILVQQFEPDIDKVARALQNRDTGFSPDEPLDPAYVEDARAAIEAMRASREIALSLKNFSV